MAGLVTAIACFSSAAPAQAPPVIETSHPQEATGETKRDRPTSQGQLATVGPARKECYGPFLRMCLVVDGKFFYEEIDGFEHQPGYEYRLRIERYDAFPGQKEPPQDAGRYGYRLLEVISKIEVAGTVSEVVLAPARVQCPESDETCLLADGKPLRGSIDGFTYEPGYLYRIQLESFAGGSRRLLQVVDKSVASGTVEEITVGPWRVGCYENAPVTAACIVVDGEPFFGVIEDFGRRHGYDYRLRVEKYDLLPDAAEPPPETAKYSYRLLEILSEKPAAEPPGAN